MMKHYENRDQQISTGSIAELTNMLTDYTKETVLRVKNSDPDRIVLTSIDEMSRMIDFLAVLINGLRLLDSQSSLTYQDLINEEMKGKSEYHQGV